METANGMVGRFIGAGVFCRDAFHPAQSILENASSPGAVVTHQHGTVGPRRCRP
jgi:hypothetical protein